MVVGTVEEVGGKREFADFKEPRVILGVPSGRISRGDAPFRQSDEPSTGHGEIGQGIRFG
jgi:hypothetical protein